MTPPAPLPPPADVCLLLRAHAEARWLSHEVVPVLREIERSELSADQTEAAHAYLEVLWMEARGRAAETDNARIELDAIALGGSQGLHSPARRYHAAVRRLRTAIERRVSTQLAAGGGVATRGSLSV